MKYTNPATPFRIETIPLPSKGIINAISSTLAFTIERHVSNSKKSTRKGRLESHVPVAIDPCILWNKALIVYAAMMTTMAADLQKRLEGNRDFLYESYQIAKGFEFYAEVIALGEHPWGPIFDEGIKAMALMVRELGKADPSLMPPHFLSNSRGMKTLAMHLLDVFDAKRFVVGVLGDGFGPSSGLEEVFSLN